MGRPKNFEPDVAVENAMETFWTQGFAATSPADLTAAIGIGKGSLYNTFGSKRALFDLALERYRQAGVELITEVLQRPGPVKERIREFLELLVDTDLAHPQRRGCLVINTAIELAGRDEAATKAVDQIQRASQSVLAEAIARGQRNKEISSEIDADTFALFLMNTIAGIRVMTKTVDDPRQLRQIINTALAGL